LTLMLTLALTAAACRAPATDEVKGDCADVGALRVCWTGAATTVVARPAASAARRSRTAAFVCDGARCEQPHPRMPDDGEWRCADTGGATVCAGGEPAAGVAPARQDPAWFCGQRRGATPPERVCVDFSPDLPNGAQGSGSNVGWRCQTLYDGPVRRVCDRDAPGRTLGAACDAGRPCVDGSRCTGGRCVPERPAPSCVLDGDCDTGRCRFGSCLTGST
jgi:hypothetical protein